MSDPKAQTAEYFIKQRIKNLEFFKKRYPEIYAAFCNFQVKNTDLLVSPDEPDVDLIVEGQSLYHGKARGYAAKEVAQFLKINFEGKLQKTYSPPLSHNYNGLRFSNSILKKTASASPLNDSGFVGYPLTNFFPFVVFLGTGLGYQIELLLKQTEVMNAVIFEPNPEIFSSSLYTVDWEAICSKFLDVKGKSIFFSLGVGVDVEGAGRLLERDLSKWGPFYPGLSLFFTHLGNKNMKKLADSVMKDIPSFLAGWGNYDDEVRRLNNSLHNLSQNFDVLVPNAVQAKNRPVLVCGSGPSIDIRINDIKLCREEVILVSAGTGIRALLKNGLTPDFHVELDPDYIIYEILSEFSEALDNVTLIAVEEVSPKVLSLFKNKYIFFKTENPHSYLFGMEEFCFSNCNPTCTNAALAIFHQLGFEQIYLFGSDYGFKSIGYHHSKQSIYAEGETGPLSRQLRNEAGEIFAEDKSFVIPSVDGGVIRTRADFYTAKRAVEKLILAAESHSKALKVFNCSLGAEINGATALSSEEFIDKIHSKELEKCETPALNHKTCVVPDERLDRALGRVSGLIDSRVTKILEEVSKGRLKGKKDVVKLISEIARQANVERHRNVGATDFGVEFMAQHLLRGTLLHFLAIGLCNAMAIADDEEAAQFSERWRVGFSEFLTQVVTHFCKIDGHRLSEDEDPWVRESIKSPESPR